MNCNLGISEIDHERWRRDWSEAAELLELTISFDKRGDLSAILIPRGVIVDKDHN